MWEVEGKLLGERKAPVAVQLRLLAWTAVEGWGSHLRALWLQQCVPARCCSDAPQVHWVWSSSGWLSATRQDCDSSTTYTPVFSKTNGLMDFAGSGVVHMVGGGSGARHWGCGE